MFTATEFTPFTATIGGLLIGLSALLMLEFNGRIAGISGIVGNLFTARGSDWFWRMAFTLGLLAGAGGYAVFSADGLNLHLETSFPMMLVSGFIVGVGTRLAKGCTSGHGVCGIGRVSARSLAATGIFMSVAALTVFVSRHVIGA